ncbi:MAG: hypothetical protein ABIO02_03360 [Patescibacteria group bacterium]
MKKQYISKQGISPMLTVLLVGIAIVIVGMIFISSQKKSMTTNQTPSSQEQMSNETITDNNGLNKAATDLDSTDEGSIDTEMTQLDSDAANL